MINRREFIKNSTIALAGLGLFGCITPETIKKTCDHILKKDYLHEIFNELPSHVHIAKSKALVDQSEFNPDRKEATAEIEGQGIIVNRQYITCAHIHDLRTQIIPGKWGGREVKGKIIEQNTYIKGQKLDQVVMDYEKDVAIFNLPKELDSLPDFPCKPKYEYKGGEEVYIIGNPGLTGTNIRKGIISDIDWWGITEKQTPDHMDDINNYFGIDVPVIGGDSGSPVINSNYELLGLAEMRVYNFCYVKKIERYTKAEEAITK